MKKVKILIARNFTVEPILDEIKEKLKKKKLNSHFFLSGYEDSVNKFLDKSSKLNKFNADIILFFYNLDAFFKNKNKITKKNSKIILEQIKQNYLFLLNIIRQKHLLEVGFCSFTETVNKNSLLKQFKKKLNLFIKNLCEKNKNCHFLDIHQFDFNNTKKKHDIIKFWNHAMYPFNFELTEKISHYLYKFICQRNGKSHKIIIVDADNTLWKGIIGENSLKEIKIGKKGIGKYYFNFQKKLKSLKDQGIVLALCTKNNIQDVEYFFKKKKMPLQIKDFSIIKANWKNKSENILNILNETNLNQDNAIFIDDSEFEIGEVKRVLPLLDTVRVPKDLKLFADFFSSMGNFNMSSITKEDKIRTKFYQSEIERQKSFKNFIKSDEYIKNLRIKIFVRHNKHQNIERLSQMTLRTNQFNTTTWRLNVNQIKSLLKNSNYLVSECSAEDKFGKYGIIGLSIIKVFKNENKAVVENTLLSCRALGRCIEEHFFQSIFNKLKQNNINKVDFIFIKTEKNKPAYNFFIKNRFTKRNFNSKIIFSCNLQKINLIPKKLIIIN